MAYLFHEKVVFQSFQLKLNMFPRWVDPQFDVVEESPDIPPLQQAPEQEENSSQGREEFVRLLHEHQSLQVEVQVSQEVVEEHLPLQVEVQVDQVEELINVEELVKETEESPDIPIQQAPEQEENSVQGREESTRLLNEHQSHQVETQVSQEAEEDFRDYLE